MDYKRYKVSLRRSDVFIVKPEAEQLDGQIFEFCEYWTIEEGESELPIAGESAMVARPGGSYPLSAPEWIASGDLEELNQAMDEQQEDDKTKIARLERKIENLQQAIECAKIDIENYKVGRELQNESIDELNDVIEEQELELKILRRSRCSGAPV